MSVISVLVIAHDPLARSLGQAAQWILGTDLENFEVLDLNPEASPQSHLSDLEKSLDRLGSGQVLILTDLFGGTPHNLALTQLQAGKVEVVSGVNLPMLLALTGLRQQFDNVEDLAPAIAKQGRHAVVDAGGKLKSHRNEYGTGELPVLPS